MKRYWLYAYQWHDAGGGMFDFKFDYDSPYEAADDFNRLVKPEYVGVDEGQIVDTATGRVWRMWCSSYRGPHTRPSEIDL